MTFLVSKEDRNLAGDIILDGSKSISNRALLIRALCEDHFEIDHLSTSDDSKAMLSLLGTDESELDAGPAGTTFRFLTAYLALQPGEQVLTGSDRMKQRPIGPLVDALNSLGADISYLEKEGYPPLLFKDPHDLGKNYKLSIPANISSQFISALLMIGPVLPRGIEVTLEGNLVSASYLQMTLTMMQDFGIEYSFEGQVITIPPQSYQGKRYKVESDWSAASYHYANAALADEVSLRLGGLRQNSMQGDSATVLLFNRLGLQTDWDDDGLTITRIGKPEGLLEHDYILCPDIAQTLAVVTGGLGIHGLFTGLETLSIKETDRIAALRDELAKVGVHFGKMPPRFSQESRKQFYAVDGKAEWSDPPLFETYHDHRMAMAFAPLGMIAPVMIKDPKVVGKSYPDFWKDLTKVGFTIQLV